MITGSRALRDAVLSCSAAWSHRDSRLSNGAKRWSNNLMKLTVTMTFTETQVEIFAIVTKADAQAWLDEQGPPAGDKAENRSPGRDQA